MKNNNYKENLDSLVKELDTLKSKKDVTEKEIEKLEIEIELFKNYLKEKEFNFEVEISFEVGNDDLYNSIYRYYNSYEEALKHYNILITFATYADVKISIKNEKYEVLKQTKITIFD